MPDHEEERAGRTFRGKVAKAEVGEIRAEALQFHVAHWHTMKDPRMRGLCLITFLDDASRCVTGAGIFSQATSENAVLVLRQSIKRFGTPATILSDNGSCFVGVRRGNPKGSWKSTTFEEELPGRGIELINSRPYRPPDQREAGAVPQDHRRGDRTLREPARVHRVLQREAAPLFAGQSPL